MSGKRDRTDGRWVLVLLFFIYCFFMLVLLFARDVPTIGKSYWDVLKFNLIPFRSIESYLSLLSAHNDGRLFKYAFVNLYGNIAVFIPIGYFLPYIWRCLRTFRRFFLSISLIILVIETMQLLSLRGCFDVDDYILNLMGSLIGFSCYRLVVHDGNI